MTDEKMSNETKRIFLIQALQDEMPQYREIEIPENEERQRQLLRSLMNVRPPWPAEKRFLEIQDSYLHEEVVAKGIVDGETLETSRVNNRLVLWQGDITTLQVDAIVNAANSALRGCFVPCHSCVDNIIHSISGIQLRLTCDELMKRQGFDEPTGAAKLTPAFNLPSRYVLHTVGPIITGALTEKDCQLLANCYHACLKLAAEHHLKSIAFCCISTGEFHFPPDKAAEIAVNTAEKFLEKNQQPERVIFNVFKEEDYMIYRKLLS